jgi:hypothetical protein
MVFHSDAPTGGTPTKVDIIAPTIPQISNLLQPWPSLKVLPTPGRCRAIWRIAFQLIYSIAANLQCLHCARHATQADLISENQT